MNVQSNIRFHYGVNVVDNTLKSLIYGKKSLPMHPNNAYKGQDMPEIDAQTFGWIWSQLQRIIRSVLAYAKITLEYEMKQ